MNGWHLRQAVRCLREGGIIAYPTEAVYGLGCDPWNPDAVARLLELKQRPWQKGLILIAADFAQLQPLLQPLSAELQAQVLPSWPGPVTWLLPTHSAIPEWLRGQHSSLAVRVTAHPVAAALCRAWGGPLISTSANKAGKPPARSSLALRLPLGKRVDKIVPGQLGGLSRPTEIRDPLTRRVLRAG